jgi:hypothetical protein
MRGALRALKTGVTTEFVSINQAAKYIGTSHVSLLYSIKSEKPFRGTYLIRKNHAIEATSTLKGALSPQYGKGGKSIFIYNENGKELI